LALIDFDMKGLPEPVAQRLADLGGVWAALASVLPALEHAPRITRASTSAGLFNKETGAKLAGSGGIHVYVGVRCGPDINRFLKNLHARCWLHGLGWVMIGAGGQPLERSIVDRVVGTPERLVFEGRPVLDYPLDQDETARRPQVEDGDLIDTIAACPPLTLYEQSTLREARVKEAMRLDAKLDTAKTEFVRVRAEQLIAAGVPADDARIVIIRQCEGVLLPHAVLPFDDPALEGKTVADVLAEPDRFEGETLADPLEGVAYGRCKAKIMRRADGTAWIHSFAHGRTVYELKIDFAGASAAINAATAANAVAEFVRLAMIADLTPAQLEEIRNKASQKSGINKRTLDAELRQARSEQRSERVREAVERRLAERSDPRLRAVAPLPDAPWLPQMQLLNDVLVRVKADEPPCRDDEGYLTEVSARAPSGLHLLRAEEANGDGDPDTRLPAPEQALLHRLSRAETGELIEHHIDYFEPSIVEERSVHLNAAFVEHFIKRGDRILPVVSAVSTLPLVLPSGALLCGPGLVRNIRTIFRVPPKLRAALPSIEQCTPSVVVEAMRFLTEDWLGDVTTDYPGKCVMIACALTIIERVLLDTRPAFMVRAGQRGGGKTTTLHMISTATLGHRAAAAAWSPNAEERRKAIFSYLMQGVPFLVWDN
jgi:hypothetical protein